MHYPRYNHQLTSIQGEVPILLTKESHDDLSYILKAIDSTGHVIILQPKEVSSPLGATGFPQPEK